MKKIILIINLLLSPALVWGQTSLNARGLGMAGAYQSLARGADAPHWNPAVLGLPDNPKLTIDFLGVGFNLGNNSLNLSMYNQYFSQDYFDANGGWDEAAKNEILNYIPSSGFNGFSSAELTALAVSYHNYAWSLSTFAFSDLQLPAELFAIPLQGLGTDPVELTEIGGEAVIGTEIAFSYGRPFDLNWDKIQHFSAGATLRYLLGHGYANIAEANGTLLSSADSIAMNGTYHTVLGGILAEDGDLGSGFGLDLGAAAVVNERLSLGIKLSNLLGSIKFDRLEESQGSFNFNQPGLNIDEFDNFEDYIDSVSFNTDTTYTSNSGASYSLPKALTLSGVYQPFAKMIVELDYRQGLNTTAGNSTTPLLALGTEYRYFDFLPTRAGIALGGLQGTTFALGLGLDLRTYQLDLALANQRGLFNGSKGFSFALSQRLTF